MMNKEKTCPACGKAEMKVVFDASPLDYSLSQSFPILRCENCGHGVTDNVMQDFSKLYNTGNYEVGENIIHMLVRPILNIFERSKANFVKRKTKGRCILEVGCGKGYFLLAARNIGFDVVGIEPSDRSRSYARKTLSSDVYCNGLLEYVSERKVNSDVVYMWHVFEHLDDISLSLNAIKNIISENGHLVIAVPNFSSIQANYSGRYWYHLDPPRHINHFTPLSIREILIKHKFKKIDIYYNSYFQDFIGEFVSITNMLVPLKNLPINLLKMNSDLPEAIKSFNGTTSILGFFAFAPVILLLSIVSLILSRILKRSGTFIVVAR